jgi:antitoxin component YwqK of YwqJK toxin-antitoxin module
VPNGGFAQFFYNHGGADGVAEAARLLDSLDVPRAGDVLHDAVAVYRKHRAKFAVDNPWDGLFGSIKDFDKLDREFGKVQLRGTRALEKWVRANIAKLAADDRGEPIEPRFTGAVEVLQPNGLVGEYLEVKNGKPHGAYREVVDDGTVRRAVFYQSGKVSADFWPTGQVKRKEMKRGPHRVIEWYYASGKLHKRLVQNKDGYAAEPIRVFHENGQLAEELHTVEGDKRGPWLKFFPDGSPKLRAEYKRNEELVVHDAWDDDGKQVVKDGTGTFRVDARDIDYEYDVYFEDSGWSEVRELRGGVPHGKATTYDDGVLSAVSHYVDGVKDGEETTYWDNGRVQDVTKYTRGRAGKSKSYPKFDRPVPAVVLTVEADEELYTAWEHPPVDEYPRALNLDEVRKQLRVPDFLREVYERNLARKRKDDYEDWNTFNDGIAYFLTVNEAGQVTAAVANGSKPYSGGSWDVYPPLLRQLKFAPGRVRGRAVPCRVLASVDHTFVEGATSAAPA